MKIKFVVKKAALLSYDKDERGLVEKLILNTNNPDDLEIIRLLEEV